MNEKFKLQPFSLTESYVASWVNGTVEFLTSFETIYFKIKKLFQM